MEEFRTLIDRYIPGSNSKDSAIAAENLEQLHSIWSTVGPESERFSGPKRWSLSEAQNKTLCMEEREKFQAWAKSVGVKDFPPSFQLRGERYVAAKIAERQALKESIIRDYEWAKKEARQPLMQALGATAVVAGIGAIFVADHLIKNGGHWTRKVSGKNDQGVAIRER